MHLTIKYMLRILTLSTRLRTRQQHIRRKTKKPRRVGRAFQLMTTSFRRGGGIRTPGGLTLNGFQDRRNRPLCHSSECVKALCGYHQKELPTIWKPWQRGGDSNPRYPCRYNGFRIRRIRPLCHLSKVQTEWFGTTKVAARATCHNFYFYIFPTAPVFYGLCLSVS